MSHKAFWVFIAHLQLLQLVFSSCSVGVAGGEGIGRVTAGQSTRDDQLFGTVDCLVEQQIGVPVSYSHLRSGGMSCGGGGGREAKYPGH